MSAKDSRQALRRKVVVSAYACLPGRGSEPGVGWNWVGQIAKHCEVWVITRSKNRPAIEAALAVDPWPNAHFVYFDLPHWACFWKRGRRGMQSYYYLWQVSVFFLARRLHKEVHFDLAHHVTFVKYWVPSFLIFLPIPFLWGPVGGGESAPFSLWRSLGIRGKLYELFRDFARKISQLDPFVRLTARRASLALATTPETEQRLRRLGCRKILLLSQVGLSNDEIRLLTQIPMHGGHPFRVASVGNLFHLKGYHLGLEAFARFHREFPDSEYCLVGSGPELARLEKLGRSLGIADKVVFCGALPRSKVLQKLADFDVLLHPALHDSGGWASIEAMAAGRPIVCLNLGGIALQVDESTGIKVSPGSVQQVVADLAAALIVLAKDPIRAKRMGEAGRKRVSTCFNWDRKGEHIAELYQGLLGSEPLRQYNEVAVSASD